MTTIRSFHLGDILSVTTGLLVSPQGMSGVHQLLDFMTSDELMTHQIPRAVRECAPVLLGRFPGMAGMSVPEEFEPEHVAPWLAEQVARFGEYHYVAPLAAGDHTVIDPFAELAMMRPDLPVIVVEAPGGDR